MVVWEDINSPGCMRSSAFQALVLFILPCCTSRGENRKHYENNHKESSVPMDFSKKGCPLLGRCITLDDFQQSFLFGSLPETGLSEKRVLIVQCPSL